MKLYYLMIVSILFSSCSTTLISDEDGDGASDGDRFITKVYSDREKLDFHYFVKDLVSDSSDSYSDVYWFAGGSPLDAPSAFLPPYEKTLTKDDVTYKLKETSANKNFSVYEIIRGADIGKFVVMAVEALPIFDKDPAVLLISSEIFDDIATAQAYGVANKIPELTLTISYLDLVFDPDTLVIENDNMADHLKAITDKYEILEIFGSKSFEEKQKLLKSFDYDVLLD